MEFGDEIFRVVIGNEVKSGHRGCDPQQICVLTRTVRGITELFSPYALRKGHGDIARSLQVRNRVLTRNQISP